MENLRTYRGFEVSGAVGIINDIIWKTRDGHPRHRASFALLVKLDDTIIRVLVQSSCPDASSLLPI